MKLLPLITLLLTGCGVSAQRAHDMDAFALIHAHHSHINFWDSANMALVDELVARGGLSDEAREEYAHGARIHTWRPETLWGRQYQGELYAYDKMGLTPEDVRAWWGMSPTGQYRVSYSQYGAVRGRSFGGGTVVTRGTRTIRTIK